MIILSALHKLSAIPQQFYQFPILGIIALILTAFAYLLLSLSENEKIRIPEKLVNVISLTIAAFLLTAMGLSIYGIAAGIAGLALFVSALILLLPLFIVFVFSIVLLFAFSSKKGWHM